MTEKRCVLGGTFEEPTILDTQTNIEYPSENYSLLDFVNNLLEENEQLKQAYQTLKHRHSLLHDVCIEAECDRDRYHKDVVSLEKEMEQLKSTNMEMEDYLGRLEEANINLQIKLQKIRDYAKEDGEVKQGIIEKVILND